MNISKKNGPAQPGIFPEGRLHPLIQAACGTTHPHTAWQAYANALGKFHPNEGEMRLFPLIADRLGGATENTPLKNLLESSQRWARMRALINRRQADTVGKIFREAGIPLLWTKGIALAHRIDQRLELRPSSDVDAIFRWQDVEQVIDLGKDRQWEPRFKLRGHRLRARYLDPELSYSLEGEGELDLGWGPRRPFIYNPFLSDWLFESSGAHTDRNGVAYACDTWLLLETIEHGVRANPVYPIRWVTDAVRLIDSCTDTIDWDTLLNFAARYRLTHLVFTAVNCLKNYTDNIPEKVFSSAAKHKSSLLDRAELHVRLASPNLASEYHSGVALNRLRREPLHLWTKLPLIRVDNTTVGTLPLKMIAIRNAITTTALNAEKLKKKTANRLRRAIPPHSNTCKRHAKP